jgi:flavoprotein
MKRIAWGITGSGDLIRETCDIMLDIKKRADIEL